MTNLRDPLGDRMKGYEADYQILLDPTLATLIRMDGKSFSTYTADSDKPFDIPLHLAMNSAMYNLMVEIPYAKIGYTQSDEISLCLPPPPTPLSETWFRGKLQKVVSVSAAIASSTFNYYYGKEKLGYFDSRVSQMEVEEVPNYFIWRQLDCHRNAISSLARKYYSPSQLEHKTQEDRLRMIQAKGDDFSNHPFSYRFGTTILRGPTHPKLQPLTLEFIKDRDQLLAALQPPEQAVTHD